MPRDFANVDSNVLHLHSKTRRAEPTSHFVEFYDDDRSLVESITRFISLGFSEGDAAIVIAEPAHRESLERDLDRIFDLRAAREQGHYVSLDAEETLERFMTDGVPDPVRFDRVIRDVMRQVSGRGKNLRIFGEMVAVLWRQGNVAGALHLEDLWNELADSEPFRLFCAYPARAFEDDLAPLTAVCDRHSHILVAGPEVP